MMPAMAAVHVPVYLSLAQAPQPVHPTTRPMAQAVSPTTRHRALFATMGITVQKMMRATAVARVQVCPTLAQTLQLARQTIFRMAQDVSQITQWLALSVMTAILLHLTTPAMAWECVRGVFSLSNMESLYTRPK